MELNEYDILSFDDNIKEAIIKKIEMYGCNYLLCERIINDELTLTFNIYKLEDDCIVEIEDEKELKEAYNEMIKKLPKLNDEQIKAICDLMVNDK